MIRNVTEVLASVGAKPQDIVKAVVHCPNPDEYPKALEILKSFFSDIRPAAAFLCTPLASANLKIEMEVTALVSEART
jgi:enamine deaminase RidA (YjgF/YER057c/UK114 family)